MGSLYFHVAANHGQQVGCSLIGNIQRPSLVHEQCGASDNSQTRDKGRE